MANEAGDCGFVFESTSHSNLQAGDMGSARMGLGATVHRFKKVRQYCQS